MSLPYRLGSRSLFVRAHEDSIKPRRVVFLSSEGTKTEVQYFNFIEKYREQLGIDSIVHIEILKRYDTNSDPENVLELLEEYIEFRKNKMFEKEIDSLSLNHYSTEFIRTYLENPSSLSQKECNQFHAVLQDEHIDLLYLNFLSRYHGEDDAFGIVIDRDCGCHSVEQMNSVVKKCKEKGYLCYITNPCIEFWQLLHVSDVASEYSESLEDILRNESDNNHNSFVSNLLYEKTGQRKAIQAKTFENYYLPNIDLAIERAKGFAPSEQLIDKLGTNLWELIELLRENEKFEKIPQEERNTQQLESPEISRIGEENKP